MSANAQSDSPEKQGVRRDYLTRFKPGVSANPGGVKRGQVFVSECYKRLLLCTSEELQNYQPKNAAEAIALRQIISGIYGQDQFALPSTKEITDRTEGRAPQKVEVSNVTNDDRRRIAIQTTMATLGFATEQEAREWLASDPQTAMIVGDVNGA